MFYNWKLWKIEMDGSYLNLRYILIFHLVDPSWQFHFSGVIFHHETKEWMETHLVIAVVLYNSTQIDLMLIGKLP